MTVVVDLTRGQTQRTGNVRVLVVDDTPALRMLMRAVLDDTDFEVVGEAGDGLTAISLAAELRPDLVLLDLAMPVMDGLEALPRLRTEVPSAKVVIVSGFERRAMERQVTEAGADAYVQKGVAPDEFLEVLHGLFPHTLEAIKDVTLDLPDQLSELLELLTSLSCELVEPVTVLTQLSARLQERVATEEERELCAGVGRTADQLRDLVAELLARSAHARGR